MHGLIGYKDTKAKCRQIVKHTQYLDLQKTKRMEKVCWPGLAPLIVSYVLLRSYLVPMHGADLKHAHFTCNTPCTLHPAAQELGHEPVPLPLCLGPPLAPAGAAAGAGLPARPPGSCHPWMA